MRGTGRLLRAGVEKIWGPGRHLAGNNTFSYFLDPHGNTIEYTTELEQIDEDTWHPHLYDFTEPEVTDQWGTANPMNEFVAKRVVQRPRQAACSSPRRSDADAFATWRARDGRSCTAGVVGDARPAPAPRRDARCSTWSRARPARRPRRRRGGARRRRPVPARREVRLLPPLAAADRPGLRRVRGARRGRRGAASTTAPGVVAGVVRGADVLLHQPVRADRRARRRPRPARLAALRLRARGRRRRRPGRRVADPGAGPRPHLRLHDPQRLVGPRPAAPRR